MSTLLFESCKYRGRILMGALFSMGGIKLKFFCRHNWDIVSTPYKEQNSTMQKYHDWNFWVMCCTKCAKLKKVIRG